MPPLYLCLHLRDFAALALTAFADSAHEENSGGPTFAADSAAKVEKQAGGLSGPVDFSSCGSTTHQAVAILSGEPPLERVFSLNSSARRLGLAIGMSRLQAESFHPGKPTTGSLGTSTFPAALLRRNRPQEERAFARLLQCAQRFSPRIEILASPQDKSCGATLLLDVSGSQRLLGSPPEIAAAVERAICELLSPQVPHRSQRSSPHLPKTGKYGPPISHEALSIAVSHNAHAALLAARGLPGAIAIAPGREAETLAPLPIRVLEPAGGEEAQTLEAQTFQTQTFETKTFETWGIRTLGQLAALEPRPLAARLGQSGLRLQAQARGQYSHLLVPAEESADAPLHAAIEMEHPVELLEPLLFLLNQLLEQVLARASQHALAIASVELCLVLEGGPHPPSFGECGDERKVGNSDPTSAKRGQIWGTMSEDRRTIRPALPERDRLALLKLIQLELETHPPAFAVCALRLTAYPAPPQTAQHGLFAAQAPEPGRMEVLLARLRKLVGEGRAGSPELLDSHAPEAFRMARFATEAGCPTFAAAFAAKVGEQNFPPALRLLRPPQAVAIRLRHGEPAALRYPERWRTVQASSGPWRTSGAWWTSTPTSQLRACWGPRSHSAWCREEWEVLLCPSKPTSGLPGAPVDLGSLGTGGLFKPSVGLSGVVDLGSHGKDWSNGSPSLPENACCLRLAHDPASGGWYVIGIYD